MDREQALTENFLRVYRIHAFQGRDHTATWRDNSHPVPFINSVTLRIPLSHDNNRDSYSRIKASVPIFCIKSFINSEVVRLPRLNKIRQGNLCV